MKKLIAITLFAAATLTGCLKDDNTPQEPTVDPM